MPRSPLTLAAAASAAVPGADILGYRELTENADGRFDSAVITTPADTELLVRIPNANDAAVELAADAAALHSLTDGARALLPFAVPQFVNFVSLANERAGVFTFLPGYQLNDGDIPVGPGAATSIGAALAAIHALPASVVREARLNERSTTAVREEIRALIDRTSRTSLAPQQLIERWRNALGNDELWQFEPTVTLGGADVRSFIFGDETVAGVSDVPVVTGVRGWHGLSIGDPAVDLAWLNAVGEAGEFVLESYTNASARTPDAGLEVRARLLSELALAKWLVYGVDTSQHDIIEDAKQMLAELADDTDDVPLALDNAAEEVWLTDDLLEVSEQLLARAPAGDEVAATSMQTDAFDRDVLRAYLDQELDETGPLPDFDLSLDDAAESDAADEPVDVAAGESADVADLTPVYAENADEDADDTDVSEAQRAAQAALQRWTNSSSE